MNTPHCLTCELIKSRAEIIYTGLLLVKKSRLNTPAKSIGALNALRVKPSYYIGDCCMTSQKQLTRYEHELELEMARLKLRTEQSCFEQEQILSERDIHIRRA